MDWGFEKARLDLCRMVWKMKIDADEEDMEMGRAGLFMGQLVDGKIV